MEFSASALHEQNSPAHLATVVEFMHWQGTRQPSPVDWTAAVDALQSLTYCLIPRLVSDGSNNSNTSGVCEGLSLPISTMLQKYMLS